MKNDQSRDFIANVALPPLPPMLLGTGPEDLDVAPNKPQGFVDAGSLVAFDDSMTAASKHDVLQSTLFAQLAANAFANRSEDIESWYGQYQKVLTAVGWSMGSVGLTDQKLGERELKVTAAAFQILSAALSGFSLGLLKTALDAIAGTMGDSGAAELFSKHSSARDAANFQLGQARQDKDGVVEMATGFFAVTTSKSDRRTVFFSWKSGDAHIRSDARILNLDPETYAQHRDIVAQRLGSATGQFIDDVPLALA